VSARVLLYTSLYSEWPLPKTSGRESSGGGANEPEVRQVAMALVELEPVADEELVRDREAHVAHRQVVDEPPVRPVEERRDVQRAGAAKGEGADEVVHRQPGVDHGVDEQHVAPRDLGVEILQEADPVVALAVSGQLDEVETVMCGQGAGEVADEWDARLQRADEQRLAVGVVEQDLRAQLADAPDDLVAVEEDLADALVVCVRTGAARSCQRAQEAFRSP
jgi:hypothetical protein